ncbi:flagellar hook-basal body complex protein FliE [Nitrincola alkalilacustris]|uniref:flagellar hook-basal body complex protein FliE n=1 Tax=Nitrincola alkalilacustris TaxID=1571224 RepID=UPI00124E531A|nr:flagellar hook-basal body complex protein FliE [Nitrincola alkalilacustris]
MIERADINSVLAQMKALRGEVQQGVRQLEIPGAIQSDKAPERTGFGTLLKSAVDQVNEQQKVANNMRESYERGDPGIDLPQVMIQAQKASVSFQAMVQVRNRLVSAYEEISKMPI